MLGIHFSSLLATSSVHWSPWLILTVPVYLAILGFAYICSKKLDDKYQTVGFHIMRFFVLAGVLVVILNVITMTASASHGSRSFESGTDSYSMEVASFMGLESGKSYPVDLGSRTEKLSGSAHFFGLSFLGTGAVRGGGSITSTSTLSIGFTVGSDSWILQLPVDKVTFKQVEGEKEPSAVMYLNDVKLEGDPYRLAWTKTHTYMQSGVMVHTIEHSKESLHPNVVAEGLPSVVGPSFARAEITLSPADYQRILNNP